MMKKKIVFLGTPAIVVPVLEQLLADNSEFEVVAVVSQPPTRAPRGQSLVPSPVHQRALTAGLPVLTPENAKADDFLHELKLLKPDLFVTAAYGQVLSEEFLAIAQFGTLNIHPSLLPLYRGAAPVQRALEDGVDVTGVTIARTVRAMDAGPIVVQREYRPGDKIKASELLGLLFEIGAKTLIDILPEYFAGKLELVEQDHKHATKARKLTIEEGLLNPDVQSSRTIHNKVRAFAGWPGTRMKLLNGDETIEVKVITTQALLNSKAKSRDIIFANGALELVCGDGSVLNILELQAPGKRAVMARDFWNGLRIKSLRWA
ncbi:MAG: hypothetical protein RLZZ488_336 [Pseudomonadota bacterium]|jgi:methionyl-tRNA formyltransferase